MSNRAQWQSHPAFQALINHNSYRHFLTIDELARWLEQDPDALLKMLGGRVTRYNTDRYMLWRAFGVESRQFGRNRDIRFCLQGCGSLFTRSDQLWVELTATATNPLYL